MTDDQKHCETCEWPLETCDETQPEGTVVYDCPREPQTWSRSLDDVWSASDSGTAEQYVLAGEGTVPGPEAPED